MHPLAMMYVTIGGALGSLMRYVMMNLLMRAVVTTFPLGTLAVNVTGSFIMGAWIALMANLLPAKAHDLHLLFAIGVLGGFTTFSTFSMDLFLLVERGQWLVAALYAVGSVVISLLALIAGGLLVRLAF